MRSRHVAGATDGYLIQIVRYGLISIVAFAVDVGILVALTEALDIHYLASATVAFVAGLYVNYVLSLKWVFNAEQRKAPGDFVVYGLVGCVGLLLNGAVIWLFTEIVGVYYVLSKVIATGVGFFWNFTARRRMYRHLESR